jgi:hypothetical protein
MLSLNLAKYLILPDYNQRPIDSVGQRRVRAVPAATKWEMAATLCFARPTSVSYLMIVPLGQHCGQVRQACLGFTKWNTDPRKARAAKAGDRMGSRNGLAPERADAS